MATNEVLIAEAMKLDAEATNGPWRTVRTPTFPGFGEHGGQCMVYSAADSCLAGYGGPPLSPDDAEFIARSRELLPEMARRLERAEALLRCIGAAR